MTPELTLEIQQNKPLCEGCADVPVEKEGDVCPECQQQITADGRSKDPAQTHGRGL